MKTLYIDMDNVLVDFPSETAACGSALLEWAYSGMSRSTHGPRLWRTLESTRHNQNQEHEVAR
jgi:hypothetical protein